MHASTVAVAGQAVMIMGAAGRGKSALALQLMAYGAVLVADDRTVLTRTGDSLSASCPQAIRGRIEARGLGILTAEYAGPTRVSLLVDLDTIEAERLPPLRTKSLLGVALPIVQNTQMPHFPAALYHYLKAGRIDPDGEHSQ